MAIRLSIALVACLALFVLMEEVNPVLAGRGKYKKLEARVKKLEDGLCGADLDCNRKETSSSKHFCKSTHINCFSLNYVSVCSMIENLTALVETIVNKVPTTPLPPKGNFKKHIYDL